MQRFFTLFLFSLLSFPSFSQQTAPDWTLSDIDGNTHHLYDVLDQGKSVVIDFSATWCPPCWSYHNTGILESIYDDFGPNGTDEVMVYFIEGDDDTNTSCLYGPSGCIGGTQGNWVAGHDHPFIDLTSSETWLLGAYNVSAFPTLFAVSPNKKRYNVGQISYNSWEDWLIESFQMSATADITHVTCLGGTGEIALTPIKGYGSISYRWNTGQTGPVLTNASPGFYTCEMTDSHGHEVEVGPFEILADGNVDFWIAVDYQIDPSCPEEDDGSIQIISNEFDVDYSWSNGDQGSLISGLPAGTYTVSATDQSSNCTKVLEVSLFDPESIDVDVDITNAACEGNEGIIEVDADGGVGEFEYSLNGEAWTDENIFSGLSAGSYTIEVIDENHCVVEQEYEVNGPQVITAISYTEDTLTCNLDSALVVSNGSSIGQDVTYTWMDTLGNIVATGDSVYLYLEDQYLLQVLDTISLCVDVDTLELAGLFNMPSFVIAEPSLLTCIETEITLVAESDNEEGTESYLWTDENGTNLGTTLDVTIDNPGIYTLQITNDLSGCVTEQSVTVEEDASIPQIEIGTPMTLNCSISSVLLEGNSLSNGEEIYEWTTENGIIIGDTDKLNAEAGGPGTYLLTVFNVISGCTSSAMVTVEANEDTPVVSLSNSNILDCNNDKTTLTAEGDAGYLYKWQDENGNELSTNNSFEIDLPGIYVCEVTNPDNNCTSVQSIEVIQDINAPSLTVDGETLLCGGSIATLCAVVDAGVNYQWEIEGEIVYDQCIDISANTEVKIIAFSLNGCSSEWTDQVIFDTSLENLSISGDTELCDGEIAEWCLNEDFDGDIKWLDKEGNVISTMPCTEFSTSGEFVLEATSDLGCSTQFEANVTVFAIPDVEIEESFSVDCNNLEVALDVYDLVIDNIAEINWTTNNGSIVDDSDSFGPIVNAAGTYDALFITGDGCEGSFSILVDEFFNYAESKFQSNADFGTVSFTDESVGSPFGWTWDFGNGEFTNEQNPTVSYEESGLYTVCLTVQNECGEDVTCEDIDVFVPGPLVVTASQINIDCNNASNGEAALQIDGGVSPYAISWSGPNGFTSMDQMISSLMPGIYQYTVQDELENMVEGTVEITQPEELFIQGVDIIDDLDGAALGSIDIEPNGGVSPYDYLWSNGETSQDIGGLTEGDYTVMITDANNCEFEQTFSVGNEISSSNVDQLELDILAMPNPANEFIQLTIAEQGDYSVDIYSSQGALMYSNNISSTITVDVTDWAAGIFIIKISDEEQRYKTVDFVKI